MSNYMCLGHVSGRDRQLARLLYRSLHRESGREPGHILA